jgi:hypothetical protein
LAALGGIVRVWGDGRGGRIRSVQSIFFCAIKFGYCAQKLTPMTERGYPEFFQILVCQIGQDGEINVILGKARGVLPETELFEPLSDLLHRAAPQDDRASPARIAKFIRNG